MIPHLVGGPLYGDVDCDGDVDFDDVSLFSSYLINIRTISENGYINADANRDGSVDLLDIIAICAIAISSM